MKEKEVQLRTRLANSKRVVIKVGTRVLVRKDGRPDKVRLKRLVKGIAQLRKDGKQVILVSSGAVGAGIERLGWKRRPRELFKLQMAAAVGQTRLINLYEDLFSKFRIKVAQVLLTHDVLQIRNKHLNARNCLHNLLEAGILPVVNENDVVVMDELREGEANFGDNDQLACLVSILTEADGMVLMSSINGLKEKTSSGRRQRVPFIDSVTEKTLKLVERGDTKGSLSKGGMESKLRAMARASKAGVLSAIIDGSKPDESLTKLFAGKSVGTLVGVKSSVTLDNKKRWIAFFHKPQGKLVVDHGARQALETGKGSLLAVGVKKVTGKFSRGDMVDIVDSSGNVIAKGLAQYSSDEARRAAGKKSAKLREILGSFSGDEMVHRNNLVVLHSTEEEVNC